MATRLKPYTALLLIALAVTGMISVIVVYSNQALPERVVWSSDREWIAFSCGLEGNESSIFTMYPDGSNIRRITSRQIVASLPTWSPDGEWIAFVKDKSLYKIRPDGTDMQQILDNSSESTFDFWDRLPAWSPDGEWIAFISNRSGMGVWDIYRVRANGSDIHRLTEGRDTHRPLAWSTDGKWIVFASSSPKETAGIYIMQSDGSKEQNISELGLEAFDPAWSPDGKWIVFSLDNGTAVNLYKFSSNGGEMQRLTNTHNADSYPAWSPDGNSIVFSSIGDNGFSQIYRIGADGSNRETITNMECHAITPTWYSFDR